MLIDSPEALKGWLTTVLEPMCDADPNALAKYVIALVKKDKPLSDLKDMCIDQLDVFLQQETKPFVDLLFDTLESKSYLKKQEPTPSTPLVPPSTQPPPTATTTNVVTPNAPHVEIPNALHVSATNNTVALSTVASNFTTSNNIVKDAKDGLVPVRDGRKLNRVDGMSDGSDRENKATGARRSSSRSPNRNRSSRSRSRNRSSRSRSRDRDDRRPRRYEKRDRRLPARRYDRYNDYRVDRSRDRVRDHDRENDRNRDSERTRSRSRTRSGSPSSANRTQVDRDRTRLENRDSTNHKMSPSTTEHGDTDYRYSGNLATPLIPTVPSSIVTVPQPVTSDSQPYAPYRNKSMRRCRDFDEMGYCMRGELCPYDHGTDPVVVEDVNLPNVIGFGPPSAQAPPTSSAPIPTIMGTSLPRPPLVRHPLPMPGPPPHGPVMGRRVNDSHPYRPEPYIPEPYNPEAPSLDRPPRMRSSYWGSRGGPSRGMGLRPPLSFQQTTRALIRVPTLDDVSQLEDHNATKNRTVVPPQKRAIDDVEKDGQVFKQDGVNNNENANKRRFDYNRLGPRKNNSDNATLELRKVPRLLNNIMQLNNHFAKFGRIVNLQVCFEGNPEAALISFSSHAEANAAYRSTEAVLNNRFIKVFWHNKENNENSKQDMSGDVAGSKKGSVKDRLGNPVPRNNNNNNTTSIVNSTSATDEVEKASVVLSSTGNLSKTVFNPAALKKNNITPPAPTTPTVPKAQLIATQETVKKKQEEQRKEVLKINANLQKRKQEIVDGYIQEQKLLIKKLEQKNLSSQERDNVMMTIKNIQECVDTVKRELITPASGNQPKSKQEAQRQLLDVEMDLYNKQHQGADTTELRKKVAELKKEATALGLIDVTKGVRGRGRGGRGVRSGLRGAHFRGRGRGVLPSTACVDHRPRKVVISGIVDDEKDDVIQHLSQFGDTESTEHDSSTHTILLSFRTRKEAELFVQAVLRGPKFKERALNMSWHKIPAVDQVADVNDENLPDSFIGEDDLGDDVRTVELLLGDDDEEEDSEARAWKR